jgi:hypothetical protein
VAERVGIPFGKIPERHEGIQSEIHGDPPLSMIRSG